MPRTLKLILATMLLGGSVFAQPAAQPATPPAEPAPGGNVPPGEVDISVKQRSNLTPNEMMTQGREYVEKMNETLKRIQTLQETARKQKDIIKLNCVTDKLVQTKVNLNIAEQAMQSLQET